MFVGHLSLALAAKRLDSEISLGWFVAAVILLDLVWPIFVLTGVERVSIIPGATAFTPLLFVYYPWSHSLTMSIVWGVLLAIVARSAGYSDRTSWVLAALVVSHWVLDFVSHAPDMPLWRGESPRLGLGLWRSIPATLIVEGSMWIAGIVLYLFPRRAKNIVGIAAFWSLVLFTTIVWASSPWSPRPTSIRALAFFAVSGIILIPWSILADRNYSMRGTYSLAEDQELNRR
jgi:hypothetical protein